MSIHFDKDRMAEIRDTYERWWNGTLGRPLVAVRIPDFYRMEESAAPVLSQKNCNDFSYSAEQIVEAIDNNLSSYEFIGDAYPHLNLDAFGPGILSAFCGAELDNSTGDVWFFPKEEKPIEELHIKYDPENPWVKRIKDICRAGTELWNGSVIIGMPDLGGNLDTVAAMRGSENLLFDLIDSPAEVKRLACETQIAWRQAYEDIASVLSGQNGFSDWSQLLSRTPSYILQCDFSFMIGTEMFSEFALDSIRSDTEHLDHTIYHLDGTGALRHLDEILKLDRLNAVQWVQGAGQPSPIHWTDVYRKIISAGKNLMIVGSPEEYLEVLPEIHGTPYFSAWLSPDEPDLAKKLITAR